MPTSTSRSPRPRRPSLPAPIPRRRTTSPCRAPAGIFTRFDPPPRSGTSAAVPKAARRDADLHLVDQIVPPANEVSVRLHGQIHVQIPGRAAPPPRLAVPLQPEPVALVHPLGNLYRHLPFTLGHPCAAAPDARVGDDGAFASAGAAGRQGHHRPEDAPPGHPDLPASGAARTPPGSRSGPGPRPRTFPQTTAARNRTVLTAPKAASSRPSIRRTRMSLPRVSGLPHPPAAEHRTPAEDPSLSEHGTEQVIERGALEEPGHVQGVTAVVAGPPCSDRKAPRRPRRSYETALRRPGRPDWRRDG